MDGTMDDVEKPDEERGELVDPAYARVRRVQVGGIAGMLGAGEVEVDESKLTQAELRDLKEREAYAIDQPWGWGARVRLTTGGQLRFACCGNLWGDGHSPWCFTPEFRVPGDAGGWLTEP